MSSVPERESPACPRTDVVASPAVTAPDHQLTVSHADPTTLTPYERNPRRGDVASIKASLQRNGQFRPLVVRRRADGATEVLAGNHTLLAAIELGWSQVAVTEVQADDEQAARIVLADNRTSDLGTYDDAELLELLQTLPDLDATGYRDDDLDRMLQQVGALGDAVAGVFDEHAAEFGGPAKAAQVDDMHSPAGGYVTTSWTILPEERDIIRRALKIVQKRLSLKTSADAIVAMARELVEREENPGGE